VDAQALWDNAGYLKADLMAPIKKELDKGPKEQKKGQQSSQTTTFIRYNVTSLRDLAAIVRALGDDAQAHRAGRVIVLPGPNTLVLTPSDAYALPVLIGDRPTFDQKKICVSYSPEYPKIVGAMSESCRETFDQLLGKAKVTPSALGGAVAHWICESSRNWRQMTVLILFAGLGTSSRTLFDCGWLPIGAEGWSHHGTWACDNNPFPRRKRQRMRTVTTRAAQPGAASRGV